MTEKQTEWTLQHCKEIKGFLENNKSAKDYEDLVGYVNVIVALAKGNKEVRDALFDVIDHMTGGVIDD